MFTNNRVVSHNLLNLTTYLWAKGLSTQIYNRYVRHNQPRLVETFKSSPGKCHRNDIESSMESLISSLKKIRTACMQPANRLSTGFKQLINYTSTVKTSEVRLTYKNQLCASGTWSINIWYTAVTAKVLRLSFTNPRTIDLYRFSPPPCLLYTSPSPRDQL